MNDLLFVYGTLRSDHKSSIRRRLARDSKFLGFGRVTGELYDLGDYPGLLLQSGSPATTVGEIYELEREKAPGVLEALDQYEGCSKSDPLPHEFDRRKVQIQMEDDRQLTAWAYVLNTVKTSATRIPSGDYSKWKKAS